DRSVRHLTTPHSTVGEIPWARILAASRNGSHTQLGASLLPRQLAVRSRLDSDRAAPGLQFLRLRIKSRRNLCIKLVKRIQCRSPCEGAPPAYSRASARPAVGRIFVITKLHRNAFQWNRESIGCHDFDGRPRPCAQVL